MLTIVWDVDDVLNDLMYQWFTCSWRVEAPECSVSFEELGGNPPHEALGITRDAYLNSLDAFRKTEQAQNMQPNAQVLAWLQDHGGDFRHIALTARPLQSAPDAAGWVMRHFGAWIRCVGVVPTRTPDNVPVYDRTKGEYLKWLRCGDIMVDDSVENILQARSLGMKTFVYPQPWNKSSVSVAALLTELSTLVVAS